MPQNCNGFVEWVTWTRTSEAVHLATLKHPANGPPPQKTLPDIIKGLNDESSKDAERQSEPRKSCTPPCRTAEAVVTKTPLPGVPVVYRWTEQVQMVNANGNPVQGEVHYTAEGKADFEKHSHRAECYPNQFGNVHYNLDDIEIKIPAKLLAVLSRDELYLALQKNGLLEEVEEVLG